MQKITPHLWFDSEAEEAANFYIDVFNSSPQKRELSKLGHIARYPKAGEAVSGKKAGTVMTVEFELEGQKFMAINGGPIFKFNESISFLVDCEDQEEIDYFWEKLSAVKESEQCGWLKDKFGLSWQIVPKELGKIMSEMDGATMEKAMGAVLQMKKLDINKIKEAAQA